MECRSLNVGFILFFENTDADNESDEADVLLDARGGANESVLSKNALVSGKHCLSPRSQHSVLKQYRQFFFEKWNISRVS